MSHEYFMQLAIDVCRQGIQKGQSPFGACIVKDGKIISSEHNIVWETTDITAHAEVHAIRSACAKRNVIDLSGCTIYSTCEPCPMCFSACHWAKIDRIVFGTSIVDAQEVGFNELPISSVDMKKLGNSGIELIGGVLYDACKQLFVDWEFQFPDKLY